MPKKEVQKIYQEIQNILFSLIPEKWESIYLYASVIKGRGEMYFYYFPKKTILKAKPINCYEVAQKFGIDEEQYNILLSRLYEKIKELNNLSVRKWTNITISVVNCLFTVEYNFNDLTHSLYTDEQRHIYWEYKYLHTPIESMNKKNQALVRYYQEEGEKPLVYTEGIYRNEDGTNVQSELAKKPWEKFQKQEVYETNVNSINEKEYSEIGKNKKIEFENLKINKFGIKNKTKKLSNEFEDDINSNLQVKNPILKF